MREEMPIFSRLNEHSLLLQWKEKGNPIDLETLLFYKTKLQNKNTQSILEINNTYNSLLITYDCTIENIDSAFEAIAELIKDEEAPIQRSIRRFTLPVCYAAEFAMDQQEVSAYLKLPFEEVISLHSSFNYRIDFLGFLPGFPYLSGLPSELHMPRKKNPVQQVPQGAVGLAETQTGIYPQSSPGGWQIIGQTPVMIFDGQQQPPSPFLPGDEIRFQAIDEDQFMRLSEKVKSGMYTWQVETLSS
ncbi:5-oxoprolinase subunit PxpB [Croceiramulus getboli]|nr:5-oxoprolinase subunit PxpB [Flavobacteriaceae bacterium YJPT1-3]